MAFLLVVAIGDVIMSFIYSHISIQKTLAKQKSNETNQVISFGKDS